MDDDGLMERMTKWARDEAHIDPHNFACPYYNDCNSSIRGTLQGGDGCLMSYVGRDYGRDVAGKSFRLVIVGMDHGESGGGTYEDRRSGIEKWYQNGGANFDQTYAGFVKIAAAVFGPAGEYCRNQCQAACQKSRNSATPHCVIDSIAQPNLVKCTPNDQVDRKSRATWSMKVNCGHHLANELRLLEPDLVAFLGNHAKWIIPAEFKSVGMDLVPIETANDESDPVLHRSTALGAHLLFLYHPSRGWLDGQWDSAVVPALDYLRRNGIIPA